MHILSVVFIDGHKDIKCYHTVSSRWLFETKGLRRWWYQVQLRSSSLLEVRASYNNIVHVIEEDISRRRGQSD
jgi:hypothetical protein